jgi:hypothetical protein
MERKKPDKANQFFKREIEESEVQQSVHYTFKDGFRLGFGFFVGFLLGSLILTLVVYVVNAIFKMF